MQKTLNLFLLVLIFFSGCTQPNIINSPTGYNLAAPDVLKMPAPLNEISGIAFKDGSADTLFAEQDEDGRLFYFSPANITEQNTKFGKKGDYEDIAILKGNVIILRSDGTLFIMPLNNIHAEKVENVQEFQGILPVEEYEAMYADETSALLYILCKSCSTDKATKSITGHILKYDAGSAPVMQSNFEINTKEIADMAKENKVSFRPSALAKNKLSNDWYILSSVNKLLVITDAQWKVKQVFELDPALFNQPEGIAFDKAHNLYISNESGLMQNATVLKFIYNAGKK